VTGSANVELVRSIFADWERGDFSAAALAHPEIEVEIADGPSPGRSTGLEDMARFLRDQLSAWEDARARADEYHVLDDERVLVLCTYNARGKTSGLEVGLMGARPANLFHVRDGKVTRWVQYWDRYRALADLGVEG
jgi:ketosteroid isomerase-like protein